MEPVVEQITPYHPTARALLRAATEALNSLYPPTSRHGIEPQEAAKGVMLVAWIDSEAVACGILRPLDADVAEIKRLFVMPEHRGKGLARALMAELEITASRLGHGIIRLENGTLQPAAIALYQKLNYRRIERFGDYASDPMSVCFEKRLTPIRHPSV